MRSPRGPESSTRSAAGQASTGRPRDAPLTSTAWATFWARLSAPWGAPRTLWLNSSGGGASLAHRGGEGALGLVDAADDLASSC